MTNENFCIAGRMRMLTRIVTSRYNEAFAGESVTFAQASLLMYIFAQPGVRQATLSRQLQIEKSAVSRDVQLLQRNGWLTDNRRQGLFLTDEGSGLAKRCHKIWKVLNAEVHSELGSEAVGGLLLLSEQIKKMSNVQ
jgi:DNA-binding MarR family transcriptional regulator